MPFPNNTNDPINGQGGSRTNVPPIEPNPRTAPNNSKDLMNTYNPITGFESKPEFSQSTAIRLVSGAQAFGIGKVKGLIDDGYNWQEKGKEYEKQWASERRDGTQPRDPKEVANDPYIDRELESHQKSLWFSGVRVIDSLVMSYPDFTTDNDKKYVGASILIQNIIMNISQKKNIVKTKITGSDGTVKQYINLDDYNVTFNGKIIGYDGYDGNGGGFVQGERPEQALRAFIDFMEAPTTVAIAQDLLEVAKITRGVICDFKIMQEVGKMDNQTFSFKLLSDSPFKIIIEDV